MDSRTKEIPLDMQLTVVICTYLRPQWLELSLRSLHQQTASRDQYEVLVVDNAGQEATRQIAQQYGVAYVLEPHLGLSHARNRGMQWAKTAWVLYLDDDIQAPQKLIERVLHRLEGATYAALGGPIRHWFATPPAIWVHKYFREPVVPTDPPARFSALTGERYLVGALLAVYKPAWSAIGGFAPHLGMKGHQVARAEEDEFQLRLRRAGYQIYYDPEITIDHLVQPYKYTITGQLKLAHASGRDGVGMRGVKQLTEWALLWRWGQITTFSLPFNLARLVFKPGYYWQNAVVDTLTKYCFAWGQYRSKRTPEL